MITASQARSMAETRWGKGGTHGYRTNRKGAFYYSCAGHGGYVIDGRCLSEAETAVLTEHISMGTNWKALEIYKLSTGKVTKFRGPENYRNARYCAVTETWRHIPIFFGEEDCDWAVVEHFTTIQIHGTKYDPIPTLKEWYPNIADLNSA
jgi:hypothetical protein